MEDWLNLINAETEGELMDIENTTQIKEIHDTSVILCELNADQKVKQEAYYREKRLHDEASASVYMQKYELHVNRSDVKFSKNHSVKIQPPYSYAN